MKLGTKHHATRGCPATVIINFLL